MDSLLFGPWIVVLPVVLALGGSGILLVLRGVPAVQSWICGLVLLLMLGVDGVLLQRVLATGPVSMTMGNWMPPFGISFTADAMGAGFALLTAFISFAVLLSVVADLPRNVVQDGFYPLLLLLAAGVSGAFLTGDLFNLYVWFEVMLIASFGLLVTPGRALQFDGAVKYGIQNFIGTTLFLLALAFLYGLLGTLNMADIIVRAQQVSPGPMVAVTALLALAFGIKAAVFPVNSWLPASYHAPPAAVSALLGGLLTKVGVYALIRVLGMLLVGAEHILHPLVMTAAVLTMIAGPLSAIAETNLRRAIGFLLIGGVGVALASIGWGSASVAGGGIAYVAHAMLTITALYLLAGVVESVTGAFETRAMGGLWVKRPGLSLLLGAMLLGVAGIPPFLGFWPKLLLLQGLFDLSGLPAGLGYNWGALAVAASILLNAFLSLIAGARLWSAICWREPPPMILGSRKASVTAPFAAAVLVAGTVLLLGLWPQRLIEAAATGTADLIDPVRYIASVGLSR